MRLIINPISGTRSKDGLAEAITAKLAEAGIDVEVAETTCRGDATRLARQAVERGDDAVLACGGDGTVNETARALANTGVTMGIIPAGSGNGLARHIGIPIDPIEALQTIINGQEADCDYGSVNGNPFFCTFGMGFDAEVADKFAASGKRGKGEYIRTALEQFVRYSPQHYRLRTSDGKVITNDAFIVAVCNASQYGNNAYIAPRASITDGQLDLIIVRTSTLLDKAMMGLDLVTGNIATNRLIDTLHVRYVVIERDQPGPAHLDGEPVTLPRRLKVHCHHGALRLFVPGKRETFKPVITPAEDMLNDLRLTLRRLLSR